MCSCCTVTHKETWNAIIMSIIQTNKDTGLLTKVLLLRISWNIFRQKKKQNNEFRKKINYAILGILHHEGLCDCHKPYSIVTRPIWTWELHWRYEE